MFFSIEKKMDHINEYENSIMSIGDSEFEGGNVEHVKWGARNLMFLFVANKKNIYCKINQEMKI